MVKLTLHLLVLATDLLTGRTCSLFVQ